MARLFADEDFSAPVVELLRQSGHDVLTVKDIRRANQRWPDEDVFSYAMLETRVLLTKNRRHFYKLHIEHSTHPGIIACTENPNFSRVAELIHGILKSHDSLTGQFIRIYQSSKS